MKLPRRRQFLHLAAGAAALPASRASQGRKPIRRGRCDRSLAFQRRRHRHRHTPDGSSLSRAARPAIRHREPARRRRQYRDRGGRARAAGRLHAPLVSIRLTQSTRHSMTSSISISSATCAGRGHRSAGPLSWWCIHRFQPRRFPNSLPMPRPIRARSTWRRPATEIRTHLAGELFKMWRRQSI